MVPVCMGLEKGNKVKKTKHFHCGFIWVNREERKGKRGQVSRVIF